MDKVKSVDDMTHPELMDEWKRLNWRIAKNKQQHAMERATAKKKIGNGKAYLDALIKLYK